MNPIRVASLPAPKSDFTGLDGCHYFYTGAEGPALRAHHQAVAEYVNIKSAGERGRVRHEELLRSCRSQLAALLNVGVENVALLSNASEALNRLVGSLRWRPGANVVTTNLEFPSVVWPLLRLRDEGVEVRVVPHRAWSLDVDELADAVDKHTQLITVSHVSYMTGLRFDLDALSALAKTVGAVLIVDATQSLGVISVDAVKADFVVASSYKWLLGPHGVGVVSCRDLQGLDTGEVGWRSVPDVFTSHRFEGYDRWPDARQLELGYPSFPSLYLLDASLRYLRRFSSSDIEAHVHTLGSRLISGLIDLDLAVLTPVEPARRAGNIAVTVPDGKTLARRLAEQGVLAWGGDGRLRLSIHLFNDEKDVDVALLELAKLL